jgi:hypothetical protein
MALSRGSHVRVPKPIFPSQVAPMDQRAGPVCVHADTVAVWPTRTGRSERRIVTATRGSTGVSARRRRREACVMVNKKVGVAEGKTRRCGPPTTRMTEGPYG